MNKLQKSIIFIKIEKCIGTVFFYFYSYSVSIIRYITNIQRFKPAASDIIPFVFIITIEAMGERRVGSRPPPIPPRSLPRRASVAVLVSLYKIADVISQPLIEANSVGFVCATASPTSSDENSSVFP